VPVNAPWPLVACTLALGAVNCKSSAGAPLLAVTKPSIDIPLAAPPGSKRSITLDDMVSLREIHEPRRSPNGQWVAFLVKQAFRRCDCYRTALYLVDSEGRSAAQKVVEEDYLANVQWLPDSRFLSYLSSRGGSVQLWRLSLATRQANRPFAHTANHDRSAEHAAYQSSQLPASGVLDYRWSPDGSRIAFTAELPPDASVVARVAKEGFRYDDGTMKAPDLVVGNWTSAYRSQQLWIYDVGAKRARLAWTTPSGWESTFTALSWSPRGGQLAFFYSNASGDGSDSMGILDVPTIQVRHVGSTGGRLFSSGSVAWSSDGGAIAYLARPQTSGSYSLEIVKTSDYSRQVQGYPLYSGFSPWLAWDIARSRILVLSDGNRRTRRQMGIYSVPIDGEEPRRLTAATEHVDDCDVILTGKVACVQQAPSVPPRVALVSIADGTARTLVDVNPEVASIELGPVRELHWTNSYGDETSGFLILPTRSPAGARVPLVVIGYGFNGEFVTQANSLLTTYPAQAFARDGIAVLLFNYPRFDDWEGPSFERGSRAFGYGPLASIRAIIEQLDAKGLIDPHRVGMMGHSLSGFWVQLAITQTDLFEAVEMHNGGTSSEPGTYWESGSKLFRELQEHIMGGPPYGETLQNYLGYSMTLNASRIHVPVLMEYDAMAALSAMEYYEALQHYGIPVDFFVYPNDGHVTQRPEHRFMSMQRNLDWFEFWLLGKENSAELNTQQFERWRQFRSVLAGQTRVNQIGTETN
jgi:dipeptidyl aminopeptidase/acylaminoacyl peptidase